MNKALRCVTPQNRQRKFNRAIGIRPARELVLPVLQPHQLGSGRESQLGSLVLCPPTKRCCSFLHETYTVQPSSLTFNVSTNRWWLPSASQLSLFPHYAELPPGYPFTSAFHHGKHKFFDFQDRLAPSATSVSLFLPSSIIASLLLLLIEGCQLCPPVGGFFACTFKLSAYAAYAVFCLEYLFSLTCLNHLMNLAFNKCFPGVKPL